MGLCISVYTGTGFKEVMLPNIDNANYRIKLERELFGLRKDADLFLEVLKGSWSLFNSNEYKVYCMSGEKERIASGNIRLTPGSYSFLRDNGDCFSLHITEMSSSVRPYRKVYIGETAEISIGRNPNGELFCEKSNNLPNRYAAIIYESGKHILTKYRENGIYKNGKSIGKREELKFGDCIRFPGMEILFLGDCLALDFRSPEGGRTDLSFRSGQLEKTSCAQLEMYYHRAPRRIGNRLLNTVEIEAPPKERIAEKTNSFMRIGPQITMVLPMIMGFLLMRTSAYAQNRSGLYLYSGIAMTGTSAVLSIMWNLIGRKQEKRKAETKDRLVWKEYTEYLSAIDEELNQKTQEYLSSRKKSYPDLASRLHALEDGSLWERNSCHQDFMDQRVGIGDQLSPIEIKIPKEKFELYKDKLSIRPMQIAESYRIIPKCPVLVDLSGYRIIGIAEEVKSFENAGIAEILAAQTAINNCYTDVRIAVIYDGRNSIERRYWEFARWLPHAWSGDRRVRYIASDQKSISDVSYELSKLLEERNELPEQDRRKYIPHFLIFITDEKLIENELIMNLLSEHNSLSGMTVIIMADRIEKLPNSCEIILQNSHDFKGIQYVTQYEKEPQTVTFDAIPIKEIECFARKISGVKVRAAAGEGEIPSRLSFLDLFGARKVSELRSEIRWLKNKTSENIKGAVGALNGGKILFLDIHEKYHGPHGLIAGTTGSGKSEILQTFILSLAVNYSPEDLAFLLIDYKGGGMADLFSDLPHIAGSISNLSGGQIRRAMTAIKSENQRRQRILKKHGINHIGAYTRLFKSGEAADLLPHLVIVIDEFAELKREEPEFMKELISVAQVGRSLGVHLILATQKPGGVVDENIRSNSRFKICLRVQDRQDSVELLRRPDAAYLTTAGRAYLQIGNDELFEEFQSGYSGEIYQEKADAFHNCVQLLTDTGERILFDTHDRKGASDMTQLKAVCSYLAETAESEHISNPGRLWMPPLKKQILLEELEYAEAGETFSPLRFRAGMADDPANQRQFTLWCGLPDAGNIMVLGGAGSGKSTMMQTIIYDLLHRCSPTQIQIYGLDFSSHFLDGFQCAVHTAAVLSEDDPESIGRMFFRLREELDLRKRTLKGAVFEQFLQESGETLPLILLCIDGYASFREKTEDRYEAAILKLLKEGKRHGILTMISGAGITSSEIPSRIAGCMETAICFYMQDRYAYYEAFHNSQIDVFPENIRGRGLISFEGRVLEFHAAAALAAGDDYQRIKRIKEVCSSINHNYPDYSPKKLPVIPAVPGYKDFSALIQKMEEISGDQIPIGYDYESGAVCTMDFREQYSFIITGEGRSGKKNFLRLMIKECASTGFETFIVDFSSSEELFPSCTSRISSEKALDRWLRDYLFPLFRKRNQEKQSRIKSESGEESGKTTQSDSPVLVAIADMKAFLEEVYHLDAQISGAVENIFDRGEYHRIYFAAIVSSEAGSELSKYPAWREYKKRKQGIHFGGCVNKNTWMEFQDLTFKEQMTARKPGLGMIPGNVYSEHTKFVIIPFMEKNDYS